MVKVYLVNHTHWDREWYFTTMDSLTLSDQVFTQVLDELEKNKQANFCLDGQISVVDEYVGIHPEAKKRIQKLVAEGRLFVGPWYTQTDALIPDAESIIRNLVIGIKDTKKNYGKPMMVGYLPDTFGFNAQMPTLLRQVGIGNIIFWRGTDPKKQGSSIYFYWQGLGKKQILAINFPFGYSTGIITPENKKHLSLFVKKHYDPAISFESRHQNNPEVLMPSGNDQLNIIKNVGQVISKINQESKYQTVISSYPDFISHLKKRKDLPLYQGELRTPKFARVHRTIGSVRHIIKQKNFDLEQKILKRVEPLAVIGSKCSFRIGNGLLVKLWKKLLECQPHDTLGGSVSDNVATDILHRFKEVNEIADGIENTVKKKIADNLNLNENQVLIFNTLPYEFTGQKTITVVSHKKNIHLKDMSEAIITKSIFYPSRKHIRLETPQGTQFINEPAYYKLTIKGKVKLPALGYKVFSIQKSKNILPEKNIHLPKAQNFIKYKNQLLEFKDGHLNLKIADRFLPDFLELVDIRNEGDTYDFSLSNSDYEKSLSFQSSYIESFGQKNALIVKGASKLPLSLNDETSFHPKYGHLVYTLKIYFTDDGILKCKLELDNQVLSHRLRLKFSPQIKTQQVLGQIQGGYQKTTNLSINSDWKEKYQEKPVNLYNFDKTVSIFDKFHHLTFFGGGQKEYEYHNSSLFITLMATTGQLGKANLVWRPGRASGDTTDQGHIMMKTPLAQELGLNKFVFGFKYSKQPFQEKPNNQLIQKWLNPSVFYQKQKTNMFMNRLDNKIWSENTSRKIPFILSAIKLNSDLDVSAVYPSYSDPKFFIIRLQNLTSKSVYLPESLMRRAIVIDALEKPLKEIKKIGPYDFLSLKIKL